MKVYFIFCVYLTFSVFSQKSEVKKHNVQPTSKTQLLNVRTLNSNIQVEARYFSDWNFMGKKVIGYKANKCLLLPKAAQALSKVQKDVFDQGYSLLLFDCYRPQRAVDMFSSWSKDLKDKKMKSIYYPTLEKNKLFQLGYIASKSGHSRGSTVDLTLIKNENIIKSSFKTLKYKESYEDCRLEKRKTSSGQVNMGSLYDCFSSISSTNSKDISKSAQHNRQILKQVMEKYGFKNYNKEWWHYTLKNEDNTNRYFDLPVK